MTSPRASAEKFQGGSNETKDRKIALLRLFQWGVGQRKKKTKNSKKRPENSTIKPLFTISVLWGHGLPASRCRRPWTSLFVAYYISYCYCYAVSPNPSMWASTAFSKIPKIYHYYVIYMKRW